MLNKRRCVCLVVCSQLANGPMKQVHFQRASVTYWPQLTQNRCNITDMKLKLRVVVSHLKTHQKSWFLFVWDCFSCCRILVSVILFFRIKLQKHVAGIGTHCWCILRGGGPDRSFGCAEFISGSGKKFKHNIFRMDGCLFCFPLRSPSEFIWAPSLLAESSRPAQIWDFSSKFLYWWCFTALAALI